MRAVALVFSLHEAVFSLQSTVAYSYIDSLTKVITIAKTWTYTFVLCFFLLATLCMVLLSLSGLLYVILLWAAWWDGASSS
mmetsp:Transcript_62124/g.91068  ORF Transcript_62124/g.91068 Transcript_62124/m.91068 type:complete len:81 (+) Transcript_62124:90-332(+)